MRRKDREISGTDNLLNIIGKCKVCRLGICDSDVPYVVPLNFGYSYDNGILTLYFHSAHEGKKIDIIKKNNKACFELDCDHALIDGERACNYGFTFSSVIGFGTIEFINDTQEKIMALGYLMKHQTGKDIQFDFDVNELENVAVFKMTVSEYTGKQKTA